MKVLIKNMTAYTVENGKLKELGSAETLEHIVGNVYKAPRETYVIKKDNISVLSDDSYPHRITGTDRLLDISQRVKEFKNVFPAYTDLNTNVCNTYFAMIAEYSASDQEMLKEHAVVMTRYRDLKLFIENEVGDYVQTEDIFGLKFENYPAFIYHGGLYIRDKYNQYRNVPFEPIVTAKTYMVFSAGNDNLFAMRQIGNTIKVFELGALQQFFKTPYGIIAEVETEYCNRYALYHLGKTLELIFERMSDEDFDLDTETGGLTHYVTGFSNGYKIGKSNNYVFSKGHYTKLDNI